ncbi:hypothetical protein COZ82_01485 [Candidatus Kaiserbacteria bacterium CG_4_8_14_3_um_filter_38_9]|uniref:Type II secretion system protein GspG C-terminal domain-containing protein n=1 Tax=Candidatus Kaiserbacteria bacterium CG_4_8_14_3_um_filter_38_9 TaxID=1974599 RepID=A0A2M7IP90_9BACT|nr:MAG: hypothetical protein COZ82_01485 [Candidatus Kaiserbacteria bacterium CG_4_8_14_3_um_filter_38_9]
MNLFFLKQTKPSAGFTLIELLVVIAIIGILASTVLASLSSARSSARDASRVQAIKQLQNALELYRNAHGKYPCADGVSCSTNPANGVAVNGATRNAAFDAAMAPYYKAVNDVRTGIPHSIIYKVKDNSARDGYSMLLRRENDSSIPAGTLPKNFWCSVSMNGGNSTWNGTNSNGNYTPCF